MKGRRSLLACAAASVLLGAGAGPAAADDPVLVTATVYPGGLVDTVTESQLLANPTLCPPYMGPAIDEQPGGSVQVAQSTWPLSSILACMTTSIDPASIKTVTVVGRNSPSSQLTAADLAGATSSGFPAGQLPVVEVSGSSWFYRRPPRGTNDLNAQDTGSGYNAANPMLIEVYGHPQLTADATAMPTGPGSNTYTFSVSVTGDNGAGPLAYSWDFGNGDTSVQPAPNDTFTHAGTYAVAVHVADHSSGQAGSATVTVNVDPAPATSGSTPQPGSGTSPTATSPTGTAAPGGGTPGAAPGKKTPTATGSSAGARMHHSSQSRTRAAKPRATKAAAKSPATTPASATPPPSATNPPATTRAAAPASAAAPAQPPSPPPTRPGAHKTPAAAGGRRLVNGLLLTGLNAVPESASPLVYQLPEPVQTAPAPPQVRRARTASALPGIAAGLVILLLFGLGAGRELRGQRASRSLRSAVA